MNGRAYRWQALGLLIASAIAGWYLGGYRGKVEPPVAMGTSSSHLSSPRYSKTTAKQSPEGLRHRLAKFAEQFAESSRVDPQGALAKISALQDPLATLAIDAWASAQVSRAGEAVRLIESSPNRDIATIVLRQLVRRLGSLLPADEVKRLVGPTGMLSEAAIQ